MGDNQKVSSSEKYVRDIRNIIIGVILIAVAIYVGKFIVNTMNRWEENTPKTSTPNAVIEKQRGYDY